MNRNTLIMLLSVLAVMIVGTGVAVAFLYSGSEDRKTNSEMVSGGDAFNLLPAVPSDAAAVILLSHSGPLDSRTVISLHHSGDLVPLYVYDAGKASASPEEEVAAAVDSLKSSGMWVEYLDCSAVKDIDRRLENRSVILASESEALVKSSLRHMEKAVSVIDAPGFVDAAELASGRNVLFVSNSHSGSLLPAFLTRKYASYSGFMSRISDWMVFDVSRHNDGISFEGRAVYDGEPDEFITVLEKSVPSESSVSEILPSYTRFASSLPLADQESYTEAYKEYLDTRQALPGNIAGRKALESKAGMAPDEFFRTIGLKEAATASFMLGKSLASVNLFKVGKDAAEVLNVSEPGLQSWPFAGFASAVFGDMFSLPDESCFTIADGWVVTGSRESVEEYASGRALEYTLKEYMSDASQGDMLADKKSSFVTYFSFSEAADVLDDIFRKPFLEMASGFYEGAEYAPMTLLVSKDKSGLHLSVSLKSLKLSRTKAPAFERDASVVVPQGPFEVMNSGTGKMNRFYQNSHLSLCLSEDGKDLWGVPFKEKICGVVEAIDYFANGKLQFLFGAGSRMYLIDRLGRYVNGFPVDLGKPILLGPQPYDFNDIKRYNVMVLHMDNSLEMYNMKGQKPDSWKGIKVEETIKQLPERVVVGGKSFWVVRTSIQTLIFPFVGGEPLTVFEGDKMIRPDSRITVMDISSVEVECYDGHRRTVRLK